MTEGAMRAFRIAYDGTPYHGFQRQPDVPTVEDALLDALAALGVLDGDADDGADAGASGAESDVPPGYAAAGRTDAGVSALAQTIAFRAPDWLAPRALNGALPADVRAWAHAEAPETFHATRDATARAYRYHLHALEADLGRARRAADRLAGDHDVHNLTPDDEGTERRVDRIDVRRDGAYLVVDVRASGFCRQQVRRTVTVLRRIASGDRPVEYVDAVLGEEPLTGPEGIPPAPAHPLVLVDVEYPDLGFRVDERAAADARATFAERRLDLESRSRVAGDVVDGLGE